MDDLAHFVALVIGYVIGQGLRYISRWQFWRKVAEDAKRQLQDPSSPASTPDEAATSALLSAHAPKVRKVAATIQPTETPHDGT